MFLWRAYGAIDLLAAGKTPMLVSHYHVLTLTPT